MLLILAITLMVPALLMEAVSGREPRRARVSSRRHLAIAALSIGLALASVPGVTWAASANAAPLAPVAAEQTTASVPTTKSAQAQGYAAREVSAKNLEKFQGGDTTVVIGGSALVIIVVVLLILILI